MRNTHLVNQLQTSIWSIYPNLYYKSQSGKESFLKSSQRLSSWTPVHSWMCTAFYNFQVTFQLIIHQIFKNKSQYSYCILEDTEAQRELNNLKSSNLKSRLLSLNYLFTTHYFFAILSKQYTGLGTWLGSVQTCYLTALFLCPWQLCLFHSSLTLLPFLRDWDINKFMAQHSNAGT